MIVVTGGAGFIGSALVAGLNARGVRDILIVDVLGTDQKWRNLVGLQFSDIIGRDEFLSLVENESLPSEVRGIIHMGACSATTERDADFLLENNYRYSQALCEYAVNNNLRFVYASSGATYGLGESGYSDDHEGLERLRPLNMYGYSKQLFDLWAKQQGILDRIVGVKFFNVFGPNEYHKGSMRSMVLRAFEQATETGTVRLFKSNTAQFRDGEQKRDFIYIKDCVDAVLWLYENSAVNGIFNLGSGKARTWNDLVSALFAALGTPAKIEYIEMPSEVKNQYQNFTEANVSKLRSAGYTAPFTELEAAITDYASFLTQGMRTLTT